MRSRDHHHSIWKLASGINWQPRDKLVGRLSQRTSKVFAQNCPYFVHKWHKWNEDWRTAYQPLCKRKTGFDRVSKPNIQDEHQVENQGKSSATRKTPQSHEANSRFCGSRCIRGRYGQNQTIMADKHSNLLQLNPASEPSDKHQSMTADVETKQRELDVLHASCSLPLANKDCVQSRDNLQDLKILWSLRTLNALT